MSTLIPSSSELASSTTERRSGSFDKVVPDKLLYLAPPADDKCPLLAVPEEVLVRVFAKLGRRDIARCRRLCKSLNTLLTETPSLALHQLLLSNSLRLNPNALLPVPNKPNLLPPSPAQLLETLQRRLAGFDRFQYRKKTAVQLKEAESRLYEYLEGILLRGTGGMRMLGGELAVYDLRRLGDWEDEDAGDDLELGVSEPHGAGVGGEGQGAEETEDAEVVDEEDLADTLRTTHKFGFDVAEFAVDPGQDLLVLVQIVTRSLTEHDMFFHLKSLSTFEHHPRAPPDPLKWPLELPRRSVQLGFQICDDGLFVLRHNQRIGSTDRICGWQWTTGRFAMTLMAQPVTSFESFVMLTPTSFVVPIVQTRLDTTSGRNAVLTDPSDLSWTHHLCIYAFPPFSTSPVSSDPSEPVPPPHSATLVRIIDMPTFTVDLVNDIPPPRMNIRADPPPRNDFPTHPVENVQPFMPEPNSGTFTIEFSCQTPDVPFPHYVMVIPKRALLPYVPPRDSALLRQARPKPMPIVQWDTFRHDVRLFGPWEMPASWVCYIYQNRYITPIRRDFANDADSDVVDEDDRYSADRLRLYDFDPLRVRRELLKRTHADPEYISPLQAIAGGEGAEAVSASPQVVSPSITDDPAVSAGPSNSAPASSPSKARSFIRRLSSSFKRTKINPTEVDGVSSAAQVDPAHKYDGLFNGVTLVTAETVLEANILIQEETRTGANFPYTYVDRFDFDSETLLIDDERIILVNADDSEDEEEWARPRRKTVLEVLEF